MLGQVQALAVPLGWPALLVSHSLMGQVSCPLLSLIGDDVVVSLYYKHDTSHKTCFFCTICDTNVKKVDTMDNRNIKELFFFSTHGLNRRTK